MKKRSICAFVAAALSAAMIMLPPMQVMAAETEPVTATEYISEVRIGVGKTMEEAEKSLEGYTILKNGDNNADLNEKAGGGMGSQGERVVLLGYKTTTDKSEAVTDLALMNMKGGYSVSDYEALMEKQMKEQIIPFVKNFQAAIDEYRENYNSDIEANKQRAKYIHDILDKFIDDDTGKGLGELLLNETKFEMGDAAYNKLSDAEKKNHADILTILAQSNGKATLMMENLLTRAADTEEDTWLDRFAGTTYQDIIDSSDMLPTEAKDEIAKLYDDDTKKIIGLWDEFSEDLNGYDEAVKIVEAFDESKYKAAFDEMAKMDENTSAEDADRIMNEYAEQQVKMNDAMYKSRLIAVHDKLEETEYGDGTMLDFFSRDADEVEDTEIYPLVASLSDGQRSGLDFVSLQELIVIALTTDEGYADASLDNLEKTSIYAGVDRGIYEKGGVALTSEAERKKKAAMQVEDDKTFFSPWTIAGMAVTAVSFAAFTGSAVSWARNASKLKAVNAEINLDLIELEMAYRSNMRNRKIAWGVNDVYANNPELKTQFELYSSKTSLAKSLSIGFGVAMIVLAGVTTYLTYRDMQAYYKVDFTPIPKYMVDAKDITAYNAKGEMEVIKNQSAYYKAVECNRTSGDEKYKNIGTFADMNGDVGKQWLALYAVKNEAMAPILADSLLVKVNETDLPAGYTTGIHMFGSDSAFNLNDSKYVWNANASKVFGKYVWNANASKVFVYFNVDDKPVSTSTGASVGTNTDSASVTGSVFTMGNLVLSAGIGLVLGAGIAMLIFIAMKPKKKEEKAE